MTAFRVLTRIGAVLCLVLAAVVLAANAGEYPGVTRPAFRHIVREVLPLLAVAVINLAALDSAILRAGPLRFLAPAVSLTLLAYAVPGVRPSAAPLAFMLAGIAALLAVGSVGLIVASHRREWRRAE